MGLTDGIKKSLVEHFDKYSNYDTMWLVLANHVISEDMDLGSNTHSKQAMKMPKLLQKAVDNLKELQIVKDTIQSNRAARQEMRDVADKFVYPLSDYALDGIMWGSPVGGLAGAYYWGKDDDPMWKLGPKIFFPAMGTGSIGAAIGGIYNGMRKKYLKH